MVDLILRNARTVGQADTIDLAGWLVTPPLVEPYIHLDAVSHRPAAIPPTTTTRLSTQGLSGQYT
jgi:cytosine/adenosine deaminase-related metal-dependent hydrolase